VIRAVDGHDVDAVDAAITAAKAQAVRADGKPTLICCKTVIGKGAPTKAGTADVHGAALGEKEVAATRAALGWTYPPFVIPDAIYAGWNARERGALLEEEWAQRFAHYRTAYPDLAAEFTRRIHGELPASWRETTDAFARAQSTKAEAVATRKASQQAIETYAKVLPELLGGSADLTGSVFTNWSGSKMVTRHAPGNYIHFGVREFAMCAIASGIALHGGLIPYSGTFLTFSDYARNALRMAAMMRLRSVFVFTHDSIGLGEDGPTHQSVEHAWSLRLIPGMAVWRPCDTVETAVAWAMAIERADGPTCLVLTRQNVPFQKRDDAQIAAIRRGGYVLADWNAVGTKRAVIIATGSEVSLAMGAREALAADGISARVVSMPCTSLFDRQEAAYRASVLPPDVPRVAVEAGSTDGWRKYVGAIDDPRAGVVGLDEFGESAPAGVLFKHFGFTAENVAATVKRVVAF
jgi:transketolase